MATASVKGSVLHYGSYYMVQTLLQSGELQGSDILKMICYIYKSTYFHLWLSLNKKKIIISKAVEKKLKLI